MSALLYVLLFAGAATAQMTTAFPNPINQWGTDKIGLNGSVLGVSNDHTSYRVWFDAGEDILGLIKLGTTPSTVTLGPSFFGRSHNTQRLNNVTEDEEPESIKGWRWGQACSMTQGGDPICSEYLGPAIISELQCREWNLKPSNETLYYPYSARSTWSAGYETIVRSAYDYEPFLTSGTPGYCSQGITTPTVTLTRARTYKNEEIATYQLVVTAGLEKLSATGDSAGAAMPMKTMGPMGPVVAGLGAAAAFFL